jgi:hypothetical protein
VNGTQAVDQVLLDLELLAADAVRPLVGAFVHVAVVEARLNQLLDAREMPPAIRGADEVVVRDVERAPDLAKDLLHLVAIGERILPLLLGALEDVLRVLVVPHQEPRGVALQAVIPRDHVSGDLFVGGPQVRAAVHEVDGGGEEERGHRRESGVVKNSSGVGKAPFGSASREGLPSASNRPSCPWSLKPRACPATPFAPRLAPS